MHFSSVAMRRCECLQPGELVVLEWEATEQDGFFYRAVRTWPVGQQPAAHDIEEVGGSTAFASKLTIGDNPGPDGQSSN